ncbi:glycoside hydrolase family 18 protein [Athelia psychrophila]|uniref:Glycoside hydrolase family 18 protein n=1 Tax=Athelia psychrophila TaxID=1759441 RepID=A0A166L0G0_9AGAM|nr:glycoside hydrolase family 18 protein [Fibularhizoctonia sp. CBS 109695]
MQCLALSFWLLSGAVDQADGWAALTAAQRTAIKTDYNNAGISLVVSAFGSTDTLVSSGANPTMRLTAQNLAAWVKTLGMAGVGVDFKELATFNGGVGSAENWQGTALAASRGSIHNLS